MTDDTGAAVAAAEQLTAPIEPTETQTPNPQSVASIPTKEKAEKPAEAEVKDKPKPSLRDTLKNADEKLRAKEAEEKAKAPEPKEKTEAKPAEKQEKPKAEAKPAEKVEAKPEAKGPERDDTGRFKANEEKTEQRSTINREAPARFDDAAKAEWESAPESVRGATNRVIRELEQGIQKHKVDAEEYGKLKTYADRAKESGTSLDKALERYVGMEDALRKNPLQGLNEVIRNLGLKKQDGSAVTLHDIAHHIVNQKPEERSSQQESTISQLQSEISELKQQLTGFSQSFQQQQQASVVSQIETFKNDHPRFDELEEDITFFLTSGKVEKNLPPQERLQKAYELAERLNPGTSAPSPAPAQTRAETSQDDAEVQTLKGSKSVSGAPSAGTTPSRGEPSSSIKDALKRAAARAG